jgi:hypothetical protein
VVDGERKAEEHEWRVILTRLAEERLRILQREEKFTISAKLKVASDDRRTEFGKLNAPPSTFASAKELPVRVRGDADRAADGAVELSTQDQFRLRLLERQLHAQRETENNELQQDLDNLVASTFEAQKGVLRTKEKERAEMLKTLEFQHKLRAAQQQFQQQIQRLADHHNGLVPRKTQRKLKHQMDRTERHLRVDFENSVMTVENAMTTSSEEPSRLSTPLRPPSTDPLEMIRQLAVRTPRTSLRQAVTRVKSMRGPQPTLSRSGLPPLAPSPQMSYTRGSSSANPSNPVSPEGPAPRGPRSVHPKYRMAAIGRAALPPAMALALGHAEETASASTVRVVDDPDQCRRGQRT